MSVPDAPAWHRPFPDPASAILAFVGSSCCCTFFQLALFLRWAWFGIACDAADGEARAKLRRSKSLARHASDLLAEKGLIAKVELFLDVQESRSIRVFAGEPGSSLPSDLHAKLVANWNGHGGGLSVGGFCLPDDADRVSELGISRSEPPTAEICRTDATLAEPQSVVLTRELEAAWREFRRTQPVSKMEASRGGPSSPVARCWEVESRWSDWPPLVARSEGVDSSAIHGKRWIAAARRSVDGRGRFVVVPMVAYWHKSRPDLLQADREDVMATLGGMFADSGRRGETFEIWSPVPIRKEGRAHG